MNFPTVNIQTIDLPAPPPVNNSDQTTYPDYGLTTNACGDLCLYDRGPDGASLDILEVVFPNDSSTTKAIKDAVIKALKRHGHIRANCHAVVTRINSLHLH